MRLTTRVATAATFLFALVLVFSPAAAPAATITPAGAGVEAYFASQSDVYQDSNPVAGAWTGPGGTGPYPAAAPILGVPIPLPPTVYPGPWPGNNFQAAPSTSVFNDLLGPTNFAAAQSTIDHNFNPAGTLTSDAEIVIPAWRLYQAPFAPGYAYNQLNFAAAYTVGSNPLGLGAATPAFPLTVGGSVVAGGFVQFDGVVNYSWTPINTAGIVSGPAVSLGQLTYTFNAAGGPFLATVPSVGALSASPIGDGVLELTGHMWIAGDPFEFLINNAIPEPSSLLALSVIGGLAALRRRRGGA